MIKERHVLDQTFHQMEPFNLVKLATPLFSSQADCKYRREMGFSFPFLQNVAIFLCSACKATSFIYIGYCCFINLQFQPCG